MALEIGDNWLVPAVTFPKETTLQEKPGSNPATELIQPRSQVEPMEPDPNTQWEKGMFIDIYA